MLLSLALIGAAVLVLRSRPGPGGPVTLLSLVPSQVESIRLDAPGQPPISVRQEGHRREWMIVVGGSDGVDSRWPAAEARVRAALRVLSALSGEASDPLPDAEVGSVVTIVSGDGSEWRLRLAAQSLAGRGRVVVVGPSGRPFGALTDDNLHAMFAPASVMQWRDTRALPGFDGTASRVSAVTGSGSLRLATVRGRWGMRDPIFAPAEPRIVQELLRAIESLTVVRFRDDQPEQTMDTPSLVIELESDIPSPTDDERDRRVLVRRLTVLGPADAGGVRYLARAESLLLTPHSRATETLAGPVTVEVVAEALGALPLDPDAFIARRAITVPAADVGRFQMGTLVFERTLDGWTRLDGERPAPLPSEHIDGIEAVLALLADVPADVVLRRQGYPIMGLEVLASISLRALDGSDLGSFRIGVAPLESADGKQAAAAVILQDSITRYYRAARSRDAIAWLAHHRLE